jgi:predicted membrane-bound spermidine synthase
VVNIRVSALVLTGSLSLAIIWMFTEGSRRYEVRAAGSSRRLYTNGILHSQFNTKSNTSRSIWDLMAAPILGLPNSKPSALCLGVGGGAVIRTLHYLNASTDIVGIDLDPIHLHVAERFFELDVQGVRLEQAEAVAWLSETPERFSLIVDDLFSDAEGETKRAFALSLDWLQLIKSRCSPLHFVMVVNVVEAADESCFQLFAKEQALSALSLMVSGYANKILVATDLGWTARSFRRLVSQHPALASLDFEAKTL